MPALSRWHEHWQRSAQALDGLVALEARAHDEILFTRDARAQDVYRRLGVAFRAIA